MVYFMYAIQQNWRQTMKFYVTLSIAVETVRSFDRSVKIWKQVKYSPKTIFPFDNEIFLSVLTNDEKILEHQIFFIL